MAKTYEKADRLFQKGQPEKALEIIRELPADDDDWIDGQALAVECLVELGRFVEADAAAAVVLKEDPNWATGFWVRGLAAIESAQLEQAEEYMRRAWESDETFAEAAVTLSALADFHDRHEQADEWLQRAHTADKTVPPPLHLSADAFDDLLLEVMDEFSDEVIETLEESHFRVLPMPTRRDLDEDIGLTDAAGLDYVDPEGEPPTVGLTLYQRNLEREAKDKKELKRRIGEEVEAALGQLAAAVEGR